MIISKKAKEFKWKIEVLIPEGFQNLDQWEQDVHRIGLKSMREMFKGGSC